MKAKIIVVLAMITILFGLYGLAGSLSMFAPQNIIKPKEENKIKVWQLKENVNARDEINRRLVSLVLLPESEANKLSFSEDVPINWNRGTIYRHDLKKGDYISMEDFITPEEDNYIEYVIAPNRVPFPLPIDPPDIIGGVIGNGSFVDVLALTKSDENRNSNRATKKTLSITPIFTSIKVLQVKRTVIPETRIEPAKEGIVLILELTRSQAVELIVAKEAAKIEVHKSIGNYSIEDLKANAGDVLDDFRAVTEYRANKVTIK